MYLDRISSQVTESNAFVEQRIEIAVESCLPHVHGNESGGRCHEQQEE